MIRLGRLFTICRLFFRYRLDSLLSLLPTHRLPWPVHLLILINPLRFLPASRRTLPKRLRLAIEALGPVFIKFGQTISTRRDLLEPDIAEELQLLQDRIAPSIENPEALVAELLGQPLETCFTDFDSNPIASASVAQVHAAVLLDGTQVIVKIVRPGIERVIQQDLLLMHDLADLIERFFVDASRIHAKKLVQDYEETILGELNLLYEAENTAQLRRNFVNSRLLYVPRVYWPYCRTHLLVLERISGIPIGKVDSLLAAGTNMKVLAERGVEIFFTQVFQHNFFHADMHPGNIFVDVRNPQEPSYIAVDCAIVGVLAEAHKHYLAQNLLAFFRKDFRRVASLHLESGWVSPDTDIDEFESVIQAVCEPIFEQPLSEISFGQLVVTLFETAGRFKMEVQPELVLLQKTLLNIEGLGRQLYPQLDLWTTAKPLLESWLTRQTGPIALLNNLAARSPELIESMSDWPELLAQGTLRLRRLEHRLKAQNTEIQTLKRKLERWNRSSVRRRTWLFWLLVTACLIGYGFWYGSR